jgi:glycosyltransferase involved in cell wall biosynthesis
VYLTVPFVLSWSLIEAMSAGCCIVGSDTDPVREVIDDGRHGLLADMRDPADIARRIATALDDQALRTRLGAAARARAVERYPLRDLLARHVRLVEAAAIPEWAENASIFVE